jgi:hypothetical protein
VLQYIDHMGNAKRKTPHIWLFKASWRGTALKFRIEAKDIEQAWKRAEREIKRRDGRDTVIELEVLEQVA